jgi:hypothetical protein
MTTHDEQAQMRQHLAELRQAAHGLGRDFEIRAEEIGEKIERLPSLTAQEAREAIYDIEDDFTAMGRRIEAEARALPREIGQGIAAGAVGIGRGAARVGGAARDEVEEIGHRTKEGTKNLLASAAGVRRTPMKGWTSPGSESDR